MQRWAPIWIIFLTIVGPLFSNAGWRDTVGEQNYVGLSVGLTEEEVHFVSPHPEDVSEFMAEFLDASRPTLNSDVHSVIAAAAIAFPFVFLHLFFDGNKGFIGS